MLEPTQDRWFGVWGFMVSDGFDLDLVQCNVMLINNDVQGSWGGSLVQETILAF